MAKQQRDTHKEAFWRSKIQLWKDSGLSVRAFCRKHHLSEPSFYSWRAVIAQRDRIATQRVDLPAAPPVDQPADQAEPLFLPLRLTPTPQLLEVVLADGTLVRVPAAFDADALMRLLAILRGQPC